MSRSSVMAQRKALLILNGDTYRIGVLHSKHTILHSLSVDSLLQSAAKGAFGLGGVALEVGGLSLLGGKLKTILPMAFTAYNFLSRKKLFKPPVLIALVAAGALFFFIRSKRTRSETDAE